MIAENLIYQEYNEDRILGREPYKWITGGPGGSDFGAGRSGVHLVACCDVYFDLFGPGLMASHLVNTDKFLHVHVVNPRYEQIGKMYDASAITNRLGFSYEINPRYFNREQPKLAMLRWIAAPEVYDYYVDHDGYNIAGISVGDADDLFVKNRQFPNEDITLMLHGLTEDRVRNLSPGSWDYQRKYVCGNYAWFTDVTRAFMDDLARSCETVSKWPKSANQFLLYCTYMEYRHMWRYGIVTHEKDFLLIGADGSKSGNSDAPVWTYAGNPDRRGDDPFWQKTDEILSRLALNNSHLHGVLTG